MSLFHKKVVTMLYVFKLSLKTLTMLNEVNEQIRERLMSNVEELFTCPCCDYLTLSARDCYEICPVCFWEDDGTQHPDGGSMANRLTLGEAQENFLKFGACDERAVAFIKIDAKLQYRKLDYRALNNSTPNIHNNPFAELLKGIKIKKY